MSTPMYADEKAEEKRSIDKYQPDGFSSTDTLQALVAEGKII